MGSKRRRGSIAAARGELHIRLYWRNPEDPTRTDYRWSIATRQADTEANRATLEHRLDALNAKIEAQAFFPCKEFPDHRIAAYCPCPSCAAITPFSEAHNAPATIGQLLTEFERHEFQRAHGPHRVIEASTFETKRSALQAFDQNFTWRDPESGAGYQFDALTSYTIREATPEATQHWLQAFQTRQQLLDAGSPPASTKYLKNMLSALRQALTYGQLRRYWRDHPLLTYTGPLIQASKTERHQRLNNAMFKPFTQQERDSIIAWFQDWWHRCDPKHYRGREKLRRLFLLHYVIIGFNQGLRSPSEMTALQWPAVDLEARRTDVRASREACGSIQDQVVRPYTKTLRHRSVPMNERALDSFRILQEYRQAEDDAVFWNPRAAVGNPLALDNGWAPLTGEKRIRYVFDQCLAELGIRSPSGQGQYRMRHTFVTLLLDHTTFSDEKVAALIGDEVHTMKQHYAGFCLNRWREIGDADEMDAINVRPETQLTVIK